MVPAIDAGSVIRSIPVAPPALVAQQVLVAQQAPVEPGYWWFWRLWRLW